MRHSRPTLLLYELFFLALAAGFLAETFLATGLAAAFLAAALAGFTPAALALADNCAFLREALFLWITFFLAAMSMELMAAFWNLLISAVLPLSKALLNALTASRMSFRVRVLRTLALVAVLTRFLADLMIGIRLAVSH